MVLVAQKEICTTGAVTRKAPPCPPRTTRGATCDVCTESYDGQDDPLLCCTGCGVIVHSICYGVSANKVPPTAWEEKDTKGTSTA